MATGPSGWTRTTTSRVKNPACCVDTTKGNWTDGANGGTRTRTSRLGRPAGNRYPTFALVRSPVSIVDTRAEHAPVAFTGPGTPVSCQRTRSCELFGDSARIRTRTREVWRLGCCRYTTLSFLSHVSTASETKPPHDLTRAFCRASDQNKKGLLGDRPRRPGSQRMQGL